LKSLEDENFYLKKCLQDIREEVIATSHRQHRRAGGGGGGGVARGVRGTNRGGNPAVAVAVASENNRSKPRGHEVGNGHHDWEGKQEQEEDGQEDDNNNISMNEEWQSLSKSTTNFSGLFGEKERLEAQREQEIAHDDETEHSSLPIPQPKSKSKPSSSTAGREIVGGIRKSASETTLSPPKSNAVDSSTASSSFTFNSNPISDSDGERKTQHVASQGKPEKEKPVGEVSAAHDMDRGDENTDSLNNNGKFEIKEASRFVNPLKNRLSDLLAKAKEEADSYAEIRNKYQTIHQHRTTTGGVNS
jgi:hypothetical protein